MNEQDKKQLAEFLCDQLHKFHLHGNYFSSADVLEEIDAFYKVRNLIKKRDTLQEEIDKLLGNDTPE